MSARFAGRVVIVTGAAGGIGLATACRFGEEGATVVLVDMNAQSMQPARQAVSEAGAPHVHPCACDVSVESQVQACVADVMKRFGRLDVVINNAGLMSFKPLDQFTGEDWMKILGVDLLGAFYFTKFAFGSMKPGGTIVNVASVHALRTTPMVAPYAAAKAALVSLTRSTALEGRSRGIRCNVVLPGAIETKMLRQNPEVKSGVEHIDPAELGQPPQIAAAIAFLASADSAFVSGTTLIADGGRLAEL